MLNAREFIRGIKPEATTLNPECISTLLEAINHDAVLDVGQQGFVQRMVVQMDKTMVGLEFEDYSMPVAVLAAYINTCRTY